MISQKAKTLNFFLKSMKLKENIDFLNPKRSSKPQVLNFSDAVGKTSRLLVHNRMALTITPPHNSSNDHIVYFHGGGYSFEGTMNHFYWIKKLIKHSGMTVTYVDYPLAPESTAEETLAMSVMVYESLLEFNPSHNFILMGDSAGGGLALALAMMIRDKGLKAPSKTVLFSPWLDIGLSNNQIKDFEEKDHILKTSALREIGAVYRGNLEPTHYLVSPKYGDVKGLGHIAVFFGTEEILYPDCLSFCDRHAGSDTQVRSYIYEGMPHDWVLFPLPESDMALQDAVAFIRER